MRRDAYITGIGVVASTGRNKREFLTSLLEGKSAFGVMRREGRQRESAYLGAEIPDFEPDVNATKQAARHASLSAQAALAVVREAWLDARLDSVDGYSVGMVVGGSNIQQRELDRTHEKYREREKFLRPTYGLSVFDSDVCGFCTEHLNIRAFAYTAGGASASGQVAIGLAAQAIRAGEADACIAVGALTDLSHWECQALRSLGAMGSDRYADQPELACRPFDAGHDGFIFGECSAAVVVESAASAARRGVAPYAILRSSATVMDGNRNSNPSLGGEVRAIRKALEGAGWNAGEVDYVNPHGTGSPAGDEIELEALRACGLTGARINATKSLIGHGLSAAGVVEAAATLLQMQAGRLHPTRNLEQPIDAGFGWVREAPVEHEMKKALTLSMGFGGINTALCWQRPPEGLRLT